MSKTLAQLRTFTRALLSEPTAKYWTDAELNTYINDGQNLFCDLTDCLSDISTASSVQYQSDYDCPTDYTKLQRVEFVKGNSVYDVTPATLSEQYTGTTRNSMSQPFRVNLVGDTLRFDSRPSSAAASTTLDGTITAAATTLDLTSVSGFPREGRLIIGSEVIEYWNISSTTLSPCTRGVEGTTAAVHTDLDAVTLRDIYIYHNKRAATLSSDSDTTQLPAQFENASAHYAAYIGRLKSKDYDLANNQKMTFDEFVMRGLTWAKMRVKRSWRPR